MNKTFALPDLGEGLTEGEVVSWEVAVGDEVVVDQVIAVVETAKAQVELPCPFAGTVATLHVEAGKVLPVGDALISIDVGGSGAEAGESGTSALVEDGTDRSSRTQERMTEERAGSGNVLIGYGTSEEKKGRRRRVGRRPADPTPAETVGSDRRSGRAEPSSKPGEAVRVISPLVRKLAREWDIDLYSVTPSAPGGIITRRDVEQAREAGKTTHAAAPEAPTSSAGDVRAGLRDERVPITGIRKVIAERLSRSRAEIPDATTWVDVDATGLRSMKDDLKAAVPDAKIGYLALFARIVVAGLTRFPELNARVDTDANEIVRVGQVNLSFAAQGPRGLVVPVVHGASAMTTEQLAAALRDLTERARLGTLAPAEMSGGTFTLNNYGVYGVDGSTPIINHPEAGMLGVGRIIDKPWVVEGQLSVRPVTQLSLSFDHRVCDGGVAGGFLRYVADCVERPGALLAGL
ncbi:MAG: dihydrolipoamide acetyltransferase family protein [Mobilicoccus sp.]|nr:dihydrolipoamide acetyltransferase family protein [Mobilicoccus sp.]